MESNYHEDEENDDLGMGRSYECVFCKRGFNTAQALGGHMNIHRKDRARNKPKQDEGGSKLSPHQPSPLPYATYLPTAVSSNSTLYGSNYHHPQPSNPVIPGVWRSMIFSDAERNRLPMNQDKELNLELRLGYD